MNITTAEPEVALVRLRRARRVLIVGHRNPDGDSLGSQLALAELCQQLGLEALVANYDPAPLNLGELPGCERVLVGPELPDDYPQGFDLVLTVECSELARCGFEQIDRVPILSIDHHKANSCFAEVNFLDADAPAVGEMVWRLYREAELEPSSAAATNMYVALATDTGDFRYPNTSPRAFTTAADLVRAGAAPEQVAQWVHERRSHGSVRLLGEALSTLTFDCGDRLASLWVDRAAFKRAAASPADTEDIVTLPRSIAGVKAVAFYKEWEPGVVRVSLRSKGDLDVCAVAVRFGGGGHTNASGCTIHSDLTAARTKVTRELVKMLEAEV